MASIGKRMVNEDLIKKLEKLPEGLEVVEANSTDEATETLSKLTVGDTVYSVPKAPHLYMFTIYIQNYDSAISFYIGNDYGLYNMIQDPQYQYGLELYYENALNTEDYSENIINAVAAILANIPFEPYEGQTPGMITKESSDINDFLYMTREDGLFKINFANNTADEFEFISNSNLIQELQPQTENAYNVCFELVRIF